MDVLVLGGTVFVGRNTADEALAAGHTVTVFNRGLSGEQPPGAEVIIGDRTADLSALEGRRFDLVVDTGYVPTVVRRTAELLSDSAHYAFVSTVNVFPGWPGSIDYQDKGIHDGDPDASEAPADLVDPAPYGWLKVGCERAVQRVFGPDRSTILRAASIVGPHDDLVGRLPWWLDRVNRGGDVLVPGTPADPVALLDARDLAQLALDRPGGVHEVAGRETTREDLMTACKSATASAARFVFVGHEWLGAQDVEEWTEVPLWVRDAPGAFRHKPSPVLRTRPLAQTVGDTWTWQRRLPSWTPTSRTPGMDPAKEAVLLDTWRSEKE